MLAPYTAVMCQIAHVSDSTERYRRVETGHCVPNVTFRQQKYYTLVLHATLRQLTFHSFAPP